MKWYYANGSERIGPIEQADWDRLVQTDRITPETLVWNRTLPAWTPFRDLPEEASPSPVGSQPPVDGPDFAASDTSDATPPHAGANPEEAPPESLEAYVDRMASLDYEVSTRSLLGQTFSLMKRRFLRILAFTIPPLLLMALIAELLASPLMKVAFSLIYEPALLAGIYAFYLQTIRGEGRFADLGRGFSKGTFGSVVMTKFILQGILYLCLFFGVIAVQISGVIDGTKIAEEWQQWPPMVWMVLLLVGSIALLPALYFGFCWTFAVPLILDHRTLGYQRALRLSRQKVLQHPWRISWFMTALSVLLLIPFVLLFAGSYWYAGSVEAFKELAPQIARFGVLLLICCASFFLVAILYLYETIFRQPAALPQVTADTAIS